MEVSELDEETKDLDWFAVDGTGAIGHFTTGGVGVLPRSVAASDEDLHLVCNYFCFKLPPSWDGEAILSPMAQAEARDLEGDEAVARRFSDFLEMARRGLYSFDHGYAFGYAGSWTRPCPRYCRVAVPTKPLHLAKLPMEIREILLRTVLTETRFSQDDEVRVE